MTLALCSNKSAFLLAASYLFLTSANLAFSCCSRCKSTMTYQPHKPALTTIRKTSTSMAVLGPSPTLTGAEGRLPRFALGTPSRLMRIINFQTSSGPDLLRLQAAPDSVPECRSRTHPPEAECAG